MNSIIVDRKIILVLVLVYIFILLFVTIRYHNVRELEWQLPFNVIEEIPLSWIFLNIIRSIVTAAFLAFEIALIIIIFAYKKEFLYALKLMIRGRRTWAYTELIILLILFAILNGIIIWRPSLFTQLGMSTEMELIPRTYNYTLPYDKNLNADNSQRISLSYYNLGLFYLILTFISIIIFTYLYLKFLRLGEGMEGLRQFIEAEELNKIISKTIKNLESNSDYRLIIMNCYVEMCRLFSRAGRPPLEYETPREFEKVIIARFPDVSKGALTCLTRLFEEAKYSNHKLGEREKTLAIKSLNELRRSLTNIDFLK